jgi:hypothetical protein
MLTPTPLPVLEIHGGRDMDGPYAGGAGKAGRSLLLLIGESCVRPFLASTPSAYSPPLALHLGEKYSPLANPDVSIFSTG